MHPSTAATWSPASGGPTAGKWSACWVTGPDAGRAHLFATGDTIVVGRATQADVRCDDPFLEPFHAQIGRVDERWEIVQLAGRSPLRVDETAITLGSSVIRLAPAPAGAAARVAPIGADAGAVGAPPVTVNRTPRTVATWDPRPVALEPADPPPTEPGTGGLLPAVVALAGAAVVAVVLAQPMFVLFGVIGTAAAVATWAVGRVSYRRRCREHTAAQHSRQARFESEVAAQRTAWSEFHWSAAPALHRLIEELADGAASIWRRRADHPDAHSICVGIGAVVFEPAVSGVPPGDDRVAAVLARGQPVCVDLGPGARVAAGGSAAAAVVRAAIVGLAIATGPADWQLVIVTEQPDAWSWVRQLPHLADGVGAARMVDTRELFELSRDGVAWTGCHTVVVTDIAEQLSLRTAPLRRLMAVCPGVAVVAVLPSGAAVPAVCKTVITTHVDGNARVVHDAHAGTSPVELRFVGLSVASARGCVTTLAGYRDPEDPRTAGSDVPRSVSLIELLIERGVDPLDPHSIVSGWAKAPVDAAPCAPIGLAADGVVDIDLARDGPHALLAGTTGAGKSELLRSLVLGLACSIAPDQLTFVLVDYKGGATFDALASLPHVVGTVTDLDGTLADRALRSLRAELTLRERTMREHGAADLTAARLARGSPVLPRLVVVVDEFAALAVEHPGFLHSLIGIAQRGRSLGVHLLLATQRPAGVIDEAIRANTALRIALRLNDVADAVDVVGDPTPAGFSRSVPGRAAMRLAPDELVTFQTAGAADAERIVAAVCASTSIACIGSPRRPWLDPLPARLERPIAGGAIGMIDLPDEQAQHPLTWRPEAGHLLVAGSQGSGVTSSLLTLVGAVLAGPARPEVFVVDGLGDPRWDALIEHPRCAAVVRLHHRERLWRLLDRLARRGAGRPCAGEQRAVLVIDGLASLRHELEPLDRAVELDLLERLIIDAESIGVALVIGADSVNRLPASVLARCPHRWVMHFHDPLDGAALGVPATAMPCAIPGRLVIAGGSHATAQMVVPAAIAAPHRATRPVARVVDLPPSVGADTLLASSHDGASWRVPLGVRFDDLAALELDVPDGDHVLVLGPSRSGKSHALMRFIGAWNDAGPATGQSGERERAVVLTPRRSPLDPTCTDLADAIAATNRHLAGGRRALLVIDDADLVNDDSGCLAGLIAARTAGLVVVAAGRAEALRQAYGHWSAAIRRSRIGVILTGGSDIDADLFGVAMPRSLPVAARPGLAHVVDRGDLVLGQIAVGEAVTWRR